MPNSFITSKSEQSFILPCITCSILLFASVILGIISAFFTGKLNNQVIVKCQVDNITILQTSITWNVTIFNAFNSDVITEIEKDSEAVIKRITQFPIGYQGNCYYWSSNSKTITLNWNQVADPKARDAMGWLSVSFLGLLIISCSIWSVYFAKKK